MKTRELKNGMKELVADPGKWLHMKDSDTYVPRVPVKADRASDWEEVDSKPAYTRVEYEREVERLIALRYTTGQEIQFARERETAGEKYAEYLAYVEQCKVDARANLADKDPETQDGQNL